MEIEVKYQACNLCDALHRNINDNFISVSFDVLRGGNLLVKIILAKRTTVEDDYIYDMSVEFSAAQQRDCVRKVQVEIGENHKPLRNLVYQRR